MADLASTLAGLPCGCTSRTSPARVHVIHGVPVSFLFGSCCKASGPESYDQDSIGGSECVCVCVCASVCLCALDRVRRKQHIQATDQCIVRVKHVELLAARARSDQHRQVQFT